MHWICFRFSFFPFSRFEIPGESSVRLSDKYESKVPGFKYFGDGLEQGVCGVYIQNVKQINNGPVKCILGLEQDDIEGHIDLVVACKLNQTTFFNFNSFFSTNESKIEMESSMSTSIRFQLPSHGYKLTAINMKHYIVYSWLPLRKSKKNEWEMTIFHLYDVEAVSITFFN